MRESNFSFPSQNRASVCITAALYDRRALDCTAILPLINSLTHLTYLTSTSPRIREILTMDGGLERLVRILKTTKVNDKRSGWKWSMAFQCVANVGVRGSETIRTRVVDAGMVPVIITVLDNFLKALDHVRLEKEQQQLLAAQLLSTQHPSLITTTTTPSPSMPLAAAFVGALENGNASNTIQMSEESEQLLTSYPHSPNSTTSIFPSSDYLNETSDISNAGSSNIHGITPTTNTAAASTNRFLANVTTPYDIRSSDDARSDVASWGSVADNEEMTTTMPQLPSTITGGSGANITPSLRPSQLPSNTNNNSTNPTSQSSTLEIDVLYREEDILLSLQLLAYLSKYPHLRATFHTAYPPHNVFSLVEKFTHRLHPAEIQYWAGVIMRNACRKDEARGGIRQCAYMACGKWESYPREFAKCRRCRKAKYCSKACQSKAWSEGHRWWCMERHGHGDTDSTSANGQSNSNGTSSSLGGHRSRSTNFGHSTDSLARSTTNREATPTTVTTGATSHGRGSSGSGSVLVS
ncbi:Mub1p [Rhizophagus irregularis DAOM 197198w]|uniref:Mub1p n=1 Tax=Rhizophagus irregularis (strain DAOM 197198w) TaxID=1432141 RepID=A0A015MVB8_RHIIW|nr:Mub1p [Rhizophagus irregularis DAOM 197198w]